MWRYADVMCGYVRRVRDADVKVCKYASATANCRLPTANFLSKRLRNTLRRFQNGYETATNGIKKNLLAAKNVHFWTSGERPAVNMKSALFKNFRAIPSLPKWRRGFSASYGTIHTLQGWGQVSCGQNRRRRARSVAYNRCRYQWARNQIPCYIIDATHSGAVQLAILLAGIGISWHPCGQLVVWYKYPLWRNRAYAYITDNSLRRIGYTMNIAGQLWWLGVKNTAQGFGVCFHALIKAIGLPC